MFSSNLYIYPTNSIFCKIFVRCLFVRIAQMPRLVHLMMLYTMIYNMYIQRVSTHTLNKYHYLSALKILIFTVVLTVANPSVRFV